MHQINESSETIFVFAISPFSKSVIFAIPIKFRPAYNATQLRTQHTSEKLIMANLHFLIWVILQFCVWQFCVIWTKFGHLVYFWSFWPILWFWQFWVPMWQFWRILAILCHFGYFVTFRANFGQFWTILDISANFGQLGQFWTFGPFGPFCAIFALLQLFQPKNAL